MPLGGVACVLAEEIADMVLDRKDNCAIEAREKGSFLSHSCEVKILMAVESAQVHNGGGVASNDHNERAKKCSDDKGELDGAS